MWMGAADVNKQRRSQQNQEGRWLPIQFKQGFSSIFQWISSPNYCRAWDICHYGGSGQTIQTNQIGSDKWRGYIRRNCEDIQRYSVERFWTPRGGDQRRGFSIHIKVHKRPVPTAGDKDEPFNGLSPPDGWTDGTYQPGSGAVSAAICQPSTRRLGGMVAVGRIQLQ